MAVITPNCRISLSCGTFRTAHFFSIAFQLHHWNLLSITNSVAGVEMDVNTNYGHNHRIYAKSTARQTVIVLSVWNKLLLHFHCLFNSLWGIGNSSMEKMMWWKKREQRRFSERVKFWILLWLIQLAWQCTSVICQSNNPNKHRWASAAARFRSAIRKQTMHHGCCQRTNRRNEKQERKNQCTCLHTHNNIVTKS